MRKMILLCGLLLASGQVLSAPYSDVHVGDIIDTEIGQLHPTQASIGYRQLDYKLHRYQGEPEKLFDDYCESAGQKGVKAFNAQSSLLDTTSFSCKKPVGSEPEAMKTVAIGPDNALYLTDGHHTFTNFAEMAGQGVSVKVRVTDDFRNLKDMDAFWKKMQEDHLVWLDTPKGVIQPAELPKHLGRQGMQNDEYRSLVYFARDVGYGKPPHAVPFLEFYWGKWLEKQLPLADLSLANREGYAEAVRRVAGKMTSQPAGAVIANTASGPVDARQMGALAEVNNKEMRKLVSTSGKLTWAFAQ